MNFKVLLAAFALLLFQKTLLAQLGTIVIRDEIVFFKEKFGVSNIEKFVDVYSAKACNLPSSNKLIRINNSKANWQKPLSATSPIELFYVKIEQRKRILGINYWSRIGDVELVKIETGVFVLKRACGSKLLAVNRIEMSADKMSAILTNGFHFKCDLKISDTGFQLTTASFPTNRMTIYTERLLPF